MQETTTLYHSLTALGAGTGTENWVLASGSETVCGSGSSWQQLARERGLGPQQILDGRGLYLAPGFTDIHCHGGGGVSFEQAPQLEQALAVHGRQGTSGIIASLVTNPLEDIEKTAASLAALIDGQDDRAPVRLLGIHAEGPYLSPLHRGAHNPAYLAAPTPDQIDRLYEASAGHLKQITIAPERDPGFAAIQRCLDLGIRVAVGHTDADYELARAAFEAGASLLTHAFNAMRPLHHRAPGPVAAAVDCSHVTLEAIVDGVHLHPPLVRALFSLAPGRIALITDAMAAAGCADGHYMLGSLEVEVCDSVARISGTETIAGSTLTLGTALERAVSYGVPLAEAVQAVSLTPRRALGLEGPGEGLAILNDRGQILALPGRLPSSDLP